MFNRIGRQTISAARTYGPRAVASSQVPRPHISLTLPADGLQGRVSFTPEVRRAFSLMPNVLPKQDHSKAIYGGISAAALAASLALYNLEEPKKESPYGNKHEGVVHVAKCLKNDPLDGVTVPLPKGLSHSCIHNLLTEKAPEIFTQWKKLDELFSKCKNKDLFLSNPKVLESLTLIENTITQTFEALSNEDLTSLSEAEGLTDWLEDLKQSGSYLMVRSSGAEDTEEMPNAGGNLSEEYIDPNPKALFASAGKVVASYFGISSLRNRIEAKINPFSSPLALSVMLQELIGETVDGAKDPDDIPVSLVLFTTEPNDSEEDFHVTKIVGSFGHGSGIVNYGGVNSDRIHLIRSTTQKEEILEAYQNRDKEFRLAPLRDQATRQVSLGLLANPKELQKKRVLDSTTLKRLEELSRYLEKAFNGKPMDVEIVIKRGIIHIVQARPVVRPAATGASYLGLPKIEELPKSPITQEIPTKVLVSGKARAQIITDPNQVLIRPTLKQAEDTPGSKNKSVVIVGLDEENTHPIVNFSSHGVTCLYTQNLEKAKKLVGQVSIDHPLIICPQSGAIYLWDSSIATANDYIQEGYFSHPAALGFSLEGEFPFEPIQNGKAPREIEEAIRSLKIISSAQATEKVLTRLKSSLDQEIIQAKRSYTIVTKQDSSAVLDKLEQSIARTFAEIQQNPSSIKQKLYHIKALETLLGKQPSGSLYTYSLLDANHLSEEADAILAYRAKLPRYTTPHFEELLTYKKMCCSTKAEEDFENFLVSLERLDFDRNLQNKKEELVSLLNELKQCNSLELFINLVCLPNLSPLDPLYSLDNILGSFSRKDISLLSSIQEDHKKLLKIRESLELFEDPKTFDQAWESLSPFLETFSSDAFMATFANSSKIRKLLQINLLKELIETTDLSIKSMKKSSLFSEKTKIELIKKMLTKNTDLLIAWINKLLPQAGINPNTLFSKEFQTKTIVSTYIDDMLKTPVDDLLEPSKGFSVNAALINAKTAFRRHRPQTLEDKFTLIHQNQLTLLSLLLQKNLSSESIKNFSSSPLFNELSEELTKGFFIYGESYTATLDSIEVNPSHIVCNYNIPMRNHSARVSIEEKKEGGIVMHAHFLGQARERWPTLGLYLKAIDKSQILSLEGPLQRGDQEVSFSWKIQKKENADFAMRLLTLFCSYATNIYVFEKDLIKIAKENNLFTYFMKQYLIDLQTGCEPFDLLNSVDDFVKKACIKDFLDSTENQNWLLNYLSNLKNTTMTQTPSPKDLEGQVNVASFLLHTLLNPFLDCVPPHTKQKTEETLTEMIISFLRIDIKNTKIRKFILNNSTRNLLRFFPKDLILDWIEKNIPHSNSPPLDTPQSLISHYISDKNYAKLFHLANTYAKYGDLENAAYIIYLLVKQGVYTKEGFDFLKSHKKRNKIGLVAKALIEQNQYISELLDICSSEKINDKMRMSPFTQGVYKGILEIYNLHPDAYQHQHKVIEGIRPWIANNHSTYLNSIEEKFLFLVLRHPYEFLPDALSCVHSCIEKSNLRKAAQILKFLTDRNVATKEALDFAIKNIELAEGKYLLNHTKLVLENREIFQKIANNPETSEETKMFLENLF